MENRYPDLALMYHIPNEGKRSKATGARLKAEGLKPGVPDVCLPVARCGYIGLYIEMKAAGGKTTPEQDDWLAALTKAGHKTAVFHDWEAAVTLILNYLKEGENHANIRKKHGSINHKIPDGD